MKPLRDQELEAMLDDLESDRVERKESFGKDVKTRAREAVCAFANDFPGHNKPGFLFIGAKDDGSPANLANTDQLLRHLAEIKADGRILPPPVLTVEKRHLKGADMAVVTVQPSDMPPVRFSGRIWIRTGPRRDKANQREERILTEKRRYKNLPFDIHPVPSATIDDLSRVLFENEYLPAVVAPDVLAENNRTFEEQLASTGMIHGLNEPVPTVLGLLTVGKNPQDFLRGAAIQFLRISGSGLTDEVVDDALIGGNLAQMLRQAEEKLAANIRIPIDVTSETTHHATPDYPMAAVRQILYNAVLHRTYEHTNAPVRINMFNDRIEITSPGGPYGNVTVNNFGKPGMTDYRNPNIAKVLKAYGFVQSFGRGIAIAQKTMADNGNPEPSFEVNDSTVQCVLRRRE